MVTLNEAKKYVDNVKKFRLFLKQGENILKKANSTNDNKKRITYLIKATEKLKQALKTNPRDAHTRLRLVDQLKILKEYDLALNYLNEGLMILENNSFFIHLRGRIYLEKKDYKKAIKDFDRAIFLNPNRFEFYLTRSNLKETLQDYQGALEDSKTLKKIAKNKVLTIIALKTHARLSEKLEKWRSALADYDAILMLKQNDSDILKKKIPY